MNNGEPVFINTGTFRKSGGTGATSVDWKFTSTGTFDVQTGSLSSSTWTGTNILNGNYTGGVSVNSGVSLTVASNAVLNWNGGEIDGSLSLEQGGVLNITNTANYNIFGSWTNYGTVNWSAGNILGYGPPSYNGLIYNSGLWNVQFDGQLTANNGTPDFINVGTFKKGKGAGGTTSISWDFTNTVGILDIQTNAVTLAASYNLAGGTLNFGINNLTNFGKVQLSGSPAAVAGTVSANFNGGYIPSTSNSFPVLTYTSRSGTISDIVSPFPVALGGSYGSTAFSLVVLNVRPTLNSISAQNVNEETLFNLNATGTDPDVNQSLTYALVSGPVNIGVSSSGAVTWTPNEIQGPSSNIVVLRVTDNGVPALSATNSFVVTVNEINVAPQLTVPTARVVDEQTTLNVSVSASDSDVPLNSFSYSLLSPPDGLSINPTTGAISWTPTEQQGPGVYMVKVIATDLNTNAVNQQSLSVTNSFTVTVHEVNVAPLVGTLNTQTVNPGQTVTLTATASDVDFPANGLSFSLVNPPAGASIVGNTGSFSWRLPVALANTTNTVQIRVTDNGSPTLSDTKPLTVIVNPLEPVVLSSPNYGDGTFKLTVNGFAGPDYVLAGSTNFIDWTDLATNFSPTVPFQFTNPSSPKMRFYRVRLSP
jgi:hypothetical protein